MAQEKDKIEKMLEDYNDVFADIVNAIVFEGHQVVDPDDLENLKDRSFLKENGTIRGQERDVVKLWRVNNLSQIIRISAIGFENQTKADKDMPMRVLSYDGAEYNTQVVMHKEERNARRKLTPSYPVITLVLYFGLSHWNAPRRLKECFGEWETLIPDEYRRKRLDLFAPDYKINVVEIAWLEKDEIARFRSCFREVAEMFSQIRQKKQYRPVNLSELEHGLEVLDFMSVVLGDRDLYKIVDNTRSRGGMNMNEIGRAFAEVYGKEAREEGREEGKRIGSAEMMARMIKLFSLLHAQNRAAEIEKIEKNQDLLQDYFDEFGI